MNVLNCTFDLIYRLTRILLEERKLTVSHEPLSKNPSAPANKLQTIHPSCMLLPSPMLIQYFLQSPPPNTKTQHVTCWFKVRARKSYDFISLRIPKHPACNQVAVICMMSSSAQSPAVRD